jgi:hypothetical protein
LKLSGWIIMMVIGEMDFATRKRFASRNARSMPYIPYWFESFANWFPWIVPILAVGSLWVARLSEDPTLRTIAERCFYTAMILAACVTLRTILADDGCWLLHTGSLCVMVIGAIFPQTVQPPDSFATDP